MKLGTKRLILREWEEKDKKDLIENINNVKVSENLLVVPHPYTESDADWWIKHCKEKAEENPRTSYEFCIELKSEEKAVGGIGLTGIDSEKCKIGYWLGEKYWKQGIMSEALERVLDFAFNNLKLNKIEAEIFADNAASQKLAEKLGFRRGELRKNAVTSKATGTVHNDIEFKLSREDYLK
ncbi:GNAT family N-acetyltransferase [Candidatus Woesearchaeota archaeon]|nr:GNAT family N-acetyltransferase [Candidatus Woesearchaeota archaeon]